MAGTHIIYDHKFLLECKNSPVARTPLCCLPQIPGVTSLAQSSLVKPEEVKEQNESQETMPGEHAHSPCDMLPKAWGSHLAAGQGAFLGWPQCQLLLPFPACFSQVSHPNPSPLLLQIKTSLRWTSEFPAPRFQAMAAPVGLMEVLAP